MIHNPLDTVAAYLTSEGLAFDINESRDTIRSGVEGETVAELHCLVRWVPGSLLFQVRFWLDTPIAAPHAALEYIARVNDGLFAGYFVLNLEDGAVTFTIPHEIATHPPTASVVETLWDHAVGYTDSYGGGLIRVAAGEVDAVTALNDL